MWKQAINKLITKLQPRPVVDTDLEAGYAALAAYEAREGTSTDWEEPFRWSEFT